ncbi:unnamed protein product [Clonostachys byssicola]|uniref:Uncharacterized protein n=1 Tax=Clonostachys byssicola TaxID=160290 RepID=A0A9N9YAG4_9HYPO|nr:unnamed protein product [Clonostachys byssicola]
MPRYAWGRQSNAKEHLPQTHKDAWIWEGICRHGVVGTVSSSALGSPSNADRVTSSQGCDLICSYDLQMDGKDVSPGCLPEWKEIPLPVTLELSQGGNDSSTSRKWPCYSFEPMFKAVGEMNPQMKFNDIDIICNRHSLRNLLLFCGGTKYLRSFRINLRLIQNTLLFETHDTRPFLEAGFGRAFENAARTCPAEWKEGVSHYRALRYPLGELSCVVRCEVDASHSGTEEPSWTSPPNGPDLGELSRNFENSANIRSQNESETMRQAGLKHQAMAAEIKSVAFYTSPSRWMPQLWFGRTPWLVCGTHSNGTFHEVTATNPGAFFHTWEDENQIELQKLVMVLKHLRAITRNSGEGQYAAIFQAGPQSRAREIKVFRTTKRWQALPEPLISKFWDSPIPGSA